MAKGMIYMVDGNGALTAMSPSAPPSEDRTTYESKPARKSAMTAALVNFAHPEIK